LGQSAVTVQRLWKPCKGEHADICFRWQNLSSPTAAALLVMSSEAMARS